MSILRSTCLLGRFSVGLRSRSVLSTMHSHLRYANMKITKAEPMDCYTHEERNQIAGRPLSPFTVYAPQLTTVMSLSHRAAGIVLSGYAVVLATASFLTSDMSEIACAIANYHLPGFVIFILKLGFGFPAVYHLCNGVRHLVWDSGKALELKQVYTGGYVTLAAAVALALYIAS